MKKLDLNPGLTPQACAPPEHPAGLQDTPEVHVAGGRTVPSMLAPSASPAHYERLLEPLKQKPGCRLEMGAREQPRALGRGKAACAWLCGAGMSESVHLSLKISPQTPRQALRCPWPSTSVFLITHNSRQNPRPPGCPGPPSRASRAGASSDRHPSPLERVCPGAGPAGLGSHQKLRPALRPWLSFSGWRLLLFPGVSEET